MKNLLIIYFFTLTLVGVTAYPPAPHHIIEGLVRNELGNPLDGDNIKIRVISDDGSTVVNSTVKSVIRPGVNYSLRIPMSSNSGKRMFDTKSFYHNMNFNIVISIDGKDYIPIEMIGDFQSMGRPGGITQLDLTLGEDLDGDGLPDAWERSIADAYGLSINEILPGGDNDKDGLTNLEEYKSGNYAFDSEDGVVINNFSHSNNRTEFEFFSIIGRSYKIFESTNLQKWEEKKFVIDNPEGKPKASFIAKKSKIIKAYVNSASNKSFYKIMVE